MEDRFYSVSEMCVKKLLLRTNHFDTQGLSYLWCASIRIPHINSAFPFIQRCAFSSINLFAQKSVSTLNYKFLLTLRHTEKARELVISVYIRFHTCSLLFYRQQGLYWKVRSVLFISVRSLIVYLIKKFH